MHLKLINNHVSWTVHLELFYLMFACLPNIYFLANFEVDFLINLLFLLRAEYMKTCPMVI